MDIQQFQNKLKEIQILAAQNEKKVRADVVDKFFQGDDLKQEDMQKIYDFLEIQGIQVQGREKAPSGNFFEKPKKQEIPLTREEELYLKEYLEEFTYLPDLTEEEAQEALKKGDSSAMEGLLKFYQKEVVKAAREFYRKDVFFGDLLQEGNLELLAALERVEGKEDPHAWLCSEIRSSIRLFMEEQTQQTREDQILVEKVQNLEAKLNNLTEGRNVNYSLEELAVFLGMDLEEIQAVLNLTGGEDEKN